MTRGEKFLSATAVVGGVIILWLLLHRPTGGPGSTPLQINLPGQPPQPAPINYTINIPGAVNANPPGQSSSCGCDGSNPLYATFAGLIASVTGQYQQIEQSYFDAILGSVPTWFAQNLNNVEGAYLSNGSRAIFNSL